MTPIRLDQRATHTTMHVCFGLARMQLSWPVGRVADVALSLPCLIWRKPVPANINVPARPVRM